jgi:hypothetical protein
MKWNRIVYKNKPSMVDFSTLNRPFIYLRYSNNNLLYIGETSAGLSRPTRENTGYESRVGPWDKVILIRASYNPDRRRYWEAYLISKLAPLHQIHQLCIYGKLVESKNKRPFDKEAYTKQIQGKFGRTVICFYESLRTSGMYSNKQSYLKDRNRFFKILNYMANNYNVIFSDPYNNRKRDYQYKLIKKVKEIMFTLIEKHKDKSLKN